MSNCFKYVVWTAAVLSGIGLRAEPKPEPEYLVRFCLEEHLQPGAPTGYLDPEGDTVIPAGKYFFCYTDTIRHYGIVGAKGELFAIDKNEKILFRVMIYDNGPDYMEEGKFRILDEEGKYGFADEKGIAIRPAYAFAFPFKNGLSKVTLSGQKVQIGEHWHWESSTEEWFYIDHNGNVVPPPAECDDSE